MGTVRYTVLDGEILSQSRDGVEHDYVPDPLGSTVALLDNTQTKTDTFAYWPYGGVASRTGTTSTPFQYVGTLGYYQDDQDRTYVRARELHTSQGRWMTEDPIGFEAGDFNLYRYVQNRPTHFRDASGLSVDCYLHLRKCLIEAGLEAARCAADCPSFFGFDTGKCLGACLPALIFTPLAFGICSVLCEGALSLGTLNCLHACTRFGEEMASSCHLAYQNCLRRPDPGFGFRPPISPAPPVMPFPTPRPPSFGRPPGQGRPPGVVGAIDPGLRPY